jgi:hypothetical protein
MNWVDFDLLGIETLSIHMDWGRTEPALIWHLIIYPSNSSLQPCKLNTTLLHQMCPLRTITR